MTEIETITAKVLTRWAEGVVPSHSFFHDPVMIKHYDATLTYYGEAFIQVREKDGPEEALTSVMRWAMTSLLSSQNDLSQVAQIRASDLPERLAFTAALHHIIRTVAPAVLGQDQASRIGIDTLLLW